jgi:NAD(P)-dependent dehydrogenase (short-subunit alcohol dehydrogenase family)
MTSDEGRLIVVTGASQGIGEATALAFAESEICRLALVSRSREKLNGVAEKCAATGSAAHVFPCDLTEEDAVATLGSMIHDRLGSPDIVINNAGSFAPSSVMDMPFSVWKTQIDANLTSAFLTSRVFLPSLMARGSGTLVFMGSVASTKGYPGGAAYCAAKHGVLGLARALREECKESGVRVITLLPGATYTPSWAESGLPEERFIPPEDIASLIVQACSLSSRTVVEELLVRPQLGDI